jgi:glycosyltransferase involved in cell wall biosynthesis
LGGGLRPSGLRVALLNPCFWPEVRRGSERFARELADGLIARGHRPRLVTSHPGRPSRTVEDGLEIVRNWRPPDSRLRRRRFEDHLTHVPLSYLSLRRGDDDVAHALYPTDALAAIRWSARTGRPVVLSHMGIPNRRWLVERRLRTEITLKAARGASATVALSEAARDALWRWLGIDARVVYPGVDLEAFRPPADRAEAPTLFCGADLGEPRKRVPLLLEAFRLVRRERPEARLILSRPREPGGAAEPGVELRDVDDRRVLAATYGEAWVSILPSVSEAFGLVLVEALACGTPVVGTDTGGIAEVVDRDSIGRVFEGGERELAGAILEALELAQEPGTPAACRERAEDFSIDRCVESYLDLYRELLDD